MRFQYIILIALVFVFILVIGETTITSDFNWQPILFNFITGKAIQLKKNNYTFQRNE